MEGIRDDNNNNVSTFEESSPQIPQSTAVLWGKETIKVLTLVTLVLPDAEVALLFVPLYTVPTLMTAKCVSTWDSTITIINWVTASYLSLVLGLG